MSQCNNASTETMNTFIKSTLEPLRKKMGALHVVGGSGPLDAELMLVGEAPGENEDLEDAPFVGRSGNLLTSILDKAGLKRPNLYITNTVKCRPTKGKYNRPPTDDEIEACKGVLWKEIQTVKPKIIVTLGGIATKVLLKKMQDPRFQMKDYVGQFLEVDYMTSPICPVWHPSFLLRSSRVYTDRTIEIFKKVSDAKSHISV
jgi:uracil-DNA glycosylase family 4